MQIDRFSYLEIMPIELLGIISTLTDKPSLLAPVSRKLSHASDVASGSLLTDLFKKIKEANCSHTNLCFAKKVDQMRTNSKETNSEIVRILYSLYLNAIGKDEAKKICDQHKGNILSIFLQMALKTNELDKENDENLVKIWPKLLEEIKKGKSTIGYEFPSIISSKQEKAIKTADQIRSWIEKNSFKLFHISSLSLDGLDITSIPREIITKIPRLNQLNLFNMKNMPKSSCQEIQKKFQDARKQVNVIIS